MKFYITGHYLSVEELPKAMQNVMHSNHLADVTLSSESKSQLFAQALTKMQNSSWSSGEKIRKNSCFFDYEKAVTEFNRTLMTSAAVTDYTPIMLEIEVPSDFDPADEKIYALLNEILLERLNNGNESAFEINKIIFFRSQYFPTKGNILPVFEFQPSIKAWPKQDDSGGIHTAEDIINKITTILAYNKEWIKRCHSLVPNDLPKRIKEIQTIATDKNFAAADQALGEITKVLADKSKSTDKAKAAPSLFGFKVKLGSTDEDTIALTDAIVNRDFNGLLNLENKLKSEAHQTLSPKH